VYKHSENGNLHKERQTKELEFGELNKKDMKLYFNIIIVIGCLILAGFVWLIALISIAQQDHCKLQQDLKRSEAATLHYRKLWLKANTQNLDLKRNCLYYAK